jgi:hypothetical protein
MPEFVRDHKPIDTEKEATRLAGILDRDEPNDFLYDKPIKELSRTLLQASQKEFNEILEKTAAKDSKYQGADLDLGKWNEKTKSWDWDAGRQGKGFDRVLYSATPEGMFWRIVKDGDTISKIVKEESEYLPKDRKAGFKDDLIRLNKLANPDHIMRGQALQIPNYEG